MKQGYTVSWSADQVISDAVNLGTAGFDVFYVNNQAAAAVSFQGSVDGENYYTVDRENTAAAGADATTFSIGSAFSGRWVPAECLRPFQYIKVVATATAAGNSVYFATSFGR